MFYSISRLLLPSPSFGVRISSRLLNNSVPLTGTRYVVDQMEYINSALTDDKNIEWMTLKNNALQIRGSINQKNIDAVLLKKLVTAKNFSAALSFGDFLRNSSQVLTIGATNGLLLLYYEMSKDQELPSDHKTFILASYKDLYNKYKVLDSTTCEHLLHALCAINELKKASKVLEDIYQSSKPSHSAYSTLIAKYFDNNKKSEALKLIERSVSDNRPLQAKAYDSWIAYILRKYKENKTKLKYMEEICWHIFNNTAPIDETMAGKFIEVFNTLGWEGTFTSIKKFDGQCIHCGEKLDCLKLSDDEFSALQGKVKDKLIVGSDLFLKSLPEELDRFLKFYEETGPYDIVLDALNIAYVGQRGFIQKVDLLKAVVDYFSVRKKKMLLLGRKHMLHWPRKQMQHIRSKTCSFFIDDLSQDDPYFITAAILSGSHTDFVSKDLLRSHLFVLKEEKLRHVFRRWQWQHQWMVYMNRNGKLIVQSPLKFTPCAQNKNGTWHLPFVRPSEASLPQVNDGTPDLANWLCLRPANVR